LDISRHHCLIEVLGPQSVYLRDLGSTNGTQYLGNRIQSEKVPSGSEFSLGNSTLRITYEVGAA